LAINSNEENNLALEEGIEIKQVSHSKYLGTVINKTDGIGKDEIKNRIEKNKKNISYLNSIWWDKHIRKDTKSISGRYWWNQFCYTGVKYGHLTNITEKDYRLWK
jgi:predicted transcriptional regulator